MLLSVIILSYNTQDLTLQTLRSVFLELSNSKLLKDKSEVIVVDNHSSDESVKLLKELQKKESFQLIALPENLGFPKGNNVAINRAKGDFIFLLNSDTIVQKGALELMVNSFFKNPVQIKTAVLRSHQGELDRLGVLAAQLINLDGSIQRQGGSFPTLISLIGQMFFLDDLPMVGKFFPSTQHTGKNRSVVRQAQELLQQDWVGGTAMMIRKEVFDEIGLLDENIFMYAEDVEFCLRAKDHHWDIAMQTQAKITHLGSASSSSKNAIIGELKGYLYIWGKHKPSWQYLWAKRVILIGILLRIILFGTMAKDSVKSRVYKEAWQALSAL